MIRSYGRALWERRAILLMNSWILILIARVVPLRSDIVPEEATEAGTCKHRKQKKGDNLILARINFQITKYKTQFLSWCHLGPTFLVVWPNPRRSSRHSRSPHGSSQYSNPTTQQLTFLKDLLRYCSKTLTNYTCPWNKWSVQRSRSPTQGG